MIWPIALLLAIVTLLAAAFVISICGMLGLAAHDALRRAIGRLERGWG